jgi:hypothetical protein
MFEWIGTHIFHILWSALGVWALVCLDDMSTQWRKANELEAARQKWEQRG